jgi:hypothetical protein
MTRIKFVGDHSTYHCGSAAVAEVLRAELQAAGEIVDDADFDLLIVNGEGSMHHGSASARKKIAELASAQSAGKRTMLINSVWQENPDAHTAALAKCESVVVREIFSQRDLAAHGVASEIYIDQCFHRTIDAEPFESYGASPVLTDFHSKEFGTFVRVNNAWSSEFPYIDMKNVSWSALVRSLATASALVTGRHHAVFAACKARTPFLALRSNTHKIEGLIATSGIPVPVYSDFSEIRKNLASIDRRKPLYDEFFDWMEAQPRWRLIL